MRLRSFALLGVLVAIAVGLVAVGTPMKVAQADDVTPVANLLTVHKHCVDEGSTGTFNLSLTFDFTLSGEPTPPVSELDPDTAFNQEFTISCGATNAADAANTVTLGPDVATPDISLQALFDWYAVNSGLVTDAVVTLTEEAVPGVDTSLSANNESECVWDEGSILTFEQNGIWCLITNTIADPNINITKVCEGCDPTTEFTFTLTTDGEDCRVSIDGGAFEPIASGGQFILTAGQTAEIWCPPGSNVTITEDGFEETLTDVTCSSDLGATATGDPETGSAGITLGTDVGGGIAICTFTNTPPEEDTPGIIVKKECVGIEGTFTFEVGGAATELSEDIACGESFEFGPLEPGTYTIDELIDETAGGDDGEDPCDTSCNTCDPCGDEEDGGIVTMIACSDLQQVDGTSVTVELVDVDIFCVFINSSEDLHDVLCGCGLDLEIDLDNNNTNTIGIDNSNTNNNANDNDNLNDNNNENKNENNNENTNEQNQENTQDQTNDNSQTNNIDSSPEVNIDFGKH